MNPISPLDSRYSRDTQQLATKIDEFAYYRNRIIVELRYFTKLTSITIAYNPMKDFTQSDFTAIMERERILRHDVKAIEYFIKDLPEIRATGKSHLIHVGLTSQDACSLGFALCMRDATLVILNRLTVLENTISQQLMNPATANIF
jgi:adenylosuccinate lyase